MSKKKTWARTPGVSGGTCGARWRTEDGWVITHCGHPTANYPYILYRPDREPVLAANGRGFRRLRDAQDRYEELRYKGPPLPPPHVCDWSILKRKR